MLHYVSPRPPPPPPASPLTTIALCSTEALAKVISKFPRILEYKSERTLRPRLEFLRRCGVTQEDLAKVCALGGEAAAWQGKLGRGWSQAARACMQWQ